MGNFSKHKKKKNNKINKTNENLNNKPVLDMNEDYINLSHKNMLKSNKQSLKRNKSVNNCFLSDKASSLKKKKINEQLSNISHKKGNLSVHFPQELSSNRHTNNLTDFDLQTLCLDESEIKT